MPDHPHARLARRVWKAVSTSDVKTIEALCSEDLVWHASGRGNRAGAYLGRDAVLDYLASIGDAVERFDSQLDEVLVGEKRVAVLFHVSGRRCGRELETGFILLFRVEQERIAEVWAVPRDQHAVDAFWSKARAGSSSDSARVGSA